MKAYPVSVRYWAMTVMQMSNKTSKLRQSAAGQECFVRIPGVCNFNTETTVLAHQPGGGMGLKSPDYTGSFCCSRCHDVLDGRVPTHLTKMELQYMHDQGMKRTWDWWVEHDLIEIKE